jgi:hypothetical protein
MSISANFPNVRPSLLLDFANSQQLDPRVTFSRSTTAPYYDGKTSVLAEQNLLTYSQDFTNAVWTKSGITNTGASTTAPDGTTTGSLIDDGTSTGFHVLQYSVATNGTITVSGYVKNINRQYVGLIVFGAGGSSTYISAVFDLANTTNTTSQNGSGYSVTSATMTSVGNGWYRCVLSGTVSSATLMAIYPSNSATAGYVPSYTGTNQQFYIWGSQLEQRSSVTAYNATTTSAITNYIPQLLTAPINSPRFDFNPTTGESLGLLIEQSSTNLLTYSQDFSNAAWGGFSNTSLTNNIDIALDGTQSAGLVSASSGNSVHTFYRNSAVNFTSGTTYAYSFYVKSFGVTKVKLTGISTGICPSGYFDLSTVTATANSGSTVSITDVGNGWYRCVAIKAAASTGTDLCGIVVGAVSGNDSYTGNGYSGIYIWGAQLEALAFPTSYIPTTSAQVTRAADNASMTGTNVSSWYNSAQATWYSEFNLYQTFATWGLLGNQVGSNGRIIYGNSNNVNSYDGTNVGTYINTISANIFYKVASALTPTLNTNTAQGNIPTTSATNGNLLNTTTLYVGNYQNGANYLNGHIKKISYYPQALTSTQLQSLTGS